MHYLKAGYPRKYPIPISPFSKMAGLPLPAIIFFGGYAEFPRSFKDPKNPALPLKFSPVRQNTPAPRVIPR
ncbi:MAG: hypothetical protein WCD80_08880, partial [Desulfobaccales bacterium]